MKQVHKTMNLFKPEKLYEKFSNYPQIKTKSQLEIKLASFKTGKSAQSLLTFSHRATSYNTLPKELTTIKKKPFFQNVS